jgi:hypothetical protein
MYFRPIILFFFGLLTFHVHAQLVVNIEGKRLEDPKPGWQGKLGFNFNLIQVQNQLIQAGNEFAIVHSNANRNLLFLNTINFVNANGQNLLNNGFQHFRYVNCKDSILRPEAYVQTQFNQQLSIDFRFLSGAGYRVRVVKRKNFYFYAGSSMMYEFEKNPGLEPQNNLRNNTYVSFNFKEIKQAPFNIVMYYQPNILNTLDYRIATEFKLLLTNDTRLNFQMEVQYIYDTYPPPGIKNDFYNISNSIVYNF